MRWLLLIPLTFLFISHVECKILRVGQQFIAKFTVVDEHARVTKSCIQNITTKTTLWKCTSACVRNVKCKSFNRHVETGHCELLSITKYDEIGALRREIGWEHYDTDEDDRQIGSVCMQLSSLCKDYEVCEDTFQSNPAYICRCKDGFEGEECKTYIGPGKKKENPASTCVALFRKSKGIPDGDYWLKRSDVTSQVKCVRRVHGGFGQWTSFQACSQTCGNEGIRLRTRKCDNPVPKGNGRPCLGPNEDTRTCNMETICPIHGGYGPWKEWKECNVGISVCEIQVRYKTCDSPKPQYNGEVCKEQDYEVRSCPAITTPIAKLVGSEIETITGKKIATFKNLGMEHAFLLFFKIDVAQLELSKWYNIVRVSVGTATDNDSRKTPGLRQPAIFVKRETRNEVKMYLSSSTDTDGSDKYPYGSSIKLKDSFFVNWVKVSVSQCKIAGGYRHRISLNDAQVTSTINSIPREFKHMSVYVGDESYEGAAPGAQVRRFYVRGAVGVNLEGPTQKPN